MIYEHSGREAAVSDMQSYNPFLMHRPSDYSMHSILASQPTYPTLHPGLPASMVPKLHQNLSGRTPLTAADIFLPQRLSPRPLRTVEPPESEAADDPKVELESRDLWERFHNFGTEMVITKSGRWVELSKACRCHFAACLHFTLTCDSVTRTVVACFIRNTDLH